MSIAPSPIVEKARSSLDRLDHNSSPPDPEKPTVTDTATDEETAAAGDAPPVDIKQQRWNESPTNIFRYFTTIYNFILLGMSDAVIGALLPYVRPPPSPKKATR
jgi:hypothetical protein